MSLIYGLDALTDHILLISRVLSTSLRVSIVHMVAINFKLSFCPYHNTQTFIWKNRLYISINTYIHTYIQRRKQTLEINYNTGFNSVAGRLSPVVQSVGIHVCISGDNIQISRGS